MKTLHFEIMIEAPRETVWNAIVEDAPYREWTSAFEPTSHFVGGWNTGDSIHFLGMDGEGVKRGMVSRIAEARWPEFISIQHLGFFADGVIDTSSPEVMVWAPSFENYTLTETPDGTRFSVDVDSNDDFYDMFVTVWPVALEKLREVCLVSRR